jgi:drug/metabolite transporter (DMT)-like permease
MFFFHKNKDLLNFFATSTGVIATMFFALYAIFGKILLENLHPQTLLAIGQSLSVIILCLFFGFLPEITKLRKLPKKTLFWIFMISLISGVMTPLLYLYGLQNIQASEAILLGGMEPLFLGMFGALFLKEKISHNQIFGGVSMIFGIYIIATMGFQNSFEINNGYIFILTAACLSGLSNTIFKKFLHHIPPEIIVFMRNSIGAVFMFILLPYFFEFTHNLDPLLDRNVLMPLILYVLFVIVAAQILWYKSLEVISTTKASIIHLLLPVFGILFSIIILNEEFFTYHLWGGLCILIGLILTMLHHHTHPHHHKLHRIKRM